MLVAFLGVVVVLVAFGALDRGAAMALMLSSLLVGAVGLIDDVAGAQALPRFLIHLIAATIVALSVATIPAKSLAAWGLHGHQVALGFSVLFVVSTTNLFNFMDGIDGLAASEALTVCAVGAGLNWYHDGDPGFTVALCSLAAAALGFLRWNWPKAAIFMGDVGSGFLGFTIASLALATCKDGVMPIEAWGILGGVFFVDSTVTLLRRVIAGERWLQAHRTHAYQHLARRWRSHKRVTLAVLLVNGLWLTPLAALAVAVPDYAKHCLTIALTPLFIAAFLIGSGRSERL